MVSFKDVSSLFQGSCKEVSRLANGCFQQCSEGVSRFFQEYLKAFKDFNFFTVLAKLESKMFSLERMWVYWCSFVVVGWIRPISVFSLSIRG